MKMHPFGTSISLYDFEDSQTIDCKLKLCEKDLHFFLTLVSLGHVAGKIILS